MDVRVQCAAVPLKIASIVAALVLCLACDRSSGSKIAPQPSPHFAALVDEYLDQFAQRHPSIAAGNGLHTHDDDARRLLRRRHRRGGRAGCARFRAPARRRSSPRALTPDERVDRRILQGIVDGWLLDLDTVRTWTRNPMIYASAISSGVHNLMTMESSPADGAGDSAPRRSWRRCRGCSRRLAANLKNPPRLFVERAIVHVPRRRRMLVARDLSLAFAGVADAGAAGRAEGGGRPARRAPSTSTPPSSRRGCCRQATGAYATGTANVEARYRAEELIDLPAAALLAIGERELAEGTGGLHRDGGPGRSGQRPALGGRGGAMSSRTIPKRGELVAAAQKSGRRAVRVHPRARLVDLPAGERVDRRRGAGVRPGLASMHSSPPLEPHAGEELLLHHRRAGRLAAPSARTRGCRSSTTRRSTDISAHEVVPGHYVHSLFMRRTPGKIRRIWIGLNPFPQPSSGQDGWAHYAEQLVIDEGFKRDDPRYRLAQTSEALTRICRMIVGLRLHSGEWTVDQAASSSNARRTCRRRRRGRKRCAAPTIRPTAATSSARWRRSSCGPTTPRRAARGFDLREFHERVMSNGIAPWWAHRAAAAARRHAAGDRIGPGLPAVARIGEDARAKAGGSGRAFGALGRVGWVGRVGQVGRVSRRRQL